MNPDTDRPAPKKDDRDRPPPASPDGPHPRGADEAAGGADSSPHETESSGEREKEAERLTGRIPDFGGDANHAP